jgi:hypothetical protein
MVREMVRLVGLGALLALNACTATSNALNPLYESPSERARLGERNDNALNGTQTKVDTARQALEAMSTYQRAALPKPQNPVMDPAVVRLMWVPDRLNKNGDLIPAHYYYLKVLSERWAVNDAFELEAQLNGPRGGTGTPTSNIPYVPADEKLR